MAAVAIEPLAGLMRALLHSPSQHFRRINHGCFAAGLSLFSHMDEPSQRLHLGQSASKCRTLGTGILAAVLAGSSGSDFRRIFFPFSKRPDLYIIRLRWRRR